MGERGLAGSRQYAHFYALEQTLIEGERIRFITGVNSGIVTLSDDSTEITVSSSSGGYYLITSSWSAIAEGALSLELALNGVKIPYMNYILGTAQTSLVSAIPGYIILRLEKGDIISVINYAPEIIICASTNNTSVGSSPNAAATLTLYRVADVW